MFFNFFKNIFDMRRYIERYIALKDLKVVESDRNMSS